MNTRYSSLEGKRSIPGAEYYEGVFHGQHVRFKRVFRGHRFSDRECQALCQGLKIPIYDLVMRGRLYAVAGELEPDRFSGGKDGAMMFRQMDIIPNDKSETIESLNQSRNESLIDRFTVDKDLLTDGFSDGVDAQLAAMIASDVLPPVQKIRDVDVFGGRPVKFVPVPVPTEADAESVEQKAPVMEFLSSYDTAVEEGLPECEYIEYSEEDVTGVSAKVSDEKK